VESIFDAVAKDEIQLHLHDAPSVKTIQKPGQTKLICSGAREPEHLLCPRIGMWLCAYVTDTQDEARTSAGRTTFTSATDVAHVRPMFKVPRNRDYGFVTSRLLSITSQISSTMPIFDGCSSCGSRLWLRLLSP
jgi:hypothetical protein